MEGLNNNRRRSPFLSCACILFLLCFAEPSSSSSSAVPFGREVLKQNDQRQPFPIDNQSLFVDISNNMEVTMDSDSSVINVDCVALSSSREPLDFLGHGPVSPSTAVIYYMNLNVFTPNIVSCTFEWSGMKKTLDMYDDRNFELQSKGQERRRGVRTFTASVPELYTLLSPMACRL
ncbi:hypothetical protein R1sor_018718 [Riccia sorocarpa]|uniref:Uncharacterized protein n=1 Tax=Riccia sorocarpa TaxID=122646 RepID=A0ABD3IBK5_9MARC